MKQFLRFLRTFIFTVLPVLITFATSWPGAVRIPLIGVVAGALAVGYRKVNPLAGSSQAARFFRVSVFAALPQLLTLISAFDKSWGIVFAAISGALEVSYRSAYPDDALPDDPPPP